MKFFLMLIGVSFLPNLFCNSAFAFASFESVDVRLTSGHDRFYSVLTDELFPMDVETTVFCSFQESIDLPLGVFILSEEELGHPFSDLNQLDYMAIKTRGRMLDEAPTQELECDESFTWYFGGLKAPSTPGAYYVNACFPLIEEDGETWDASGNTAGGNMFNCSEAIRLDVRQRAKADLIVSSLTLLPAKSEYAPEEPITVQATVRNIGDGRSESTELYFIRTHRTRATFADAKNNAKLPVKRLDPGESDVKNWNTKAPASVSRLNVGACVKASGILPDAFVGNVDYTDREQITDNNCSPVLIPLPVTNSNRPNIRVTKITPDTMEPTRNSSFSLSVTLEYQDDQAQFKGRYNVWRRYVPKARNRMMPPPPVVVTPTMPRDRISPIVETFKQLRSQKVASEGAIIWPGRTVNLSTPLTAPSITGDYEYWACAQFGYIEYGCSNPIRVKVK